jgi:hypothetical protein
LIDTVPDILAGIVARKREELAAPRTPLQTLERRAELALAGRRDFRAALHGRQPAIIAEMKKASPSRGVLSHSFDPACLAREYELGGAAALSVLTDRSFFQGSLQDLRRRARRRRCRCRGIAPWTSITVKPRRMESPFLPTRRSDTAPAVENWRENAFGWLVSTRAELDRASARSV